MMTDSTTTTTKASGEGKKILLLTMFPHGTTNDSSSGTMIPKLEACSEKSSSITMKESSSTFSSSSSVDNDGDIIVPTPAKKRQKTTSIMNDGKSNDSNGASVQKEDEEEEEAKKEQEIILLPMSDEHKVVLELLPSSSVPFVDVKNDVEIGEKIVCPFVGKYTKCGYGSFAEWQGKTVALKRYDTKYSKYGFIRELENYERLKEVWGELIPTPFFVGYDEEEKVFFLGMELANSPTTDDDLSEWYTDDGPFKQLKKRFGFVQLSNGRKHCKFFGGTNGEPKKLITIDLDRCLWEGEDSIFDETPDVRIY